MRINERQYHSPKINLQETTFLNMPIHNLEKEEVLKKIYELSDEKKFSYVVTPNLDHITRNYESKDIDKYENADLSICDSKVVSIIYKAIYKKKLHVNPGSDLTKDLLKEENKKKNKSSITIIGCQVKQIKKLREMFENITFNHLNPSYGFINKKHEVNEICKFIKEHPSKFILLCVGSPQQEILANEMKLKEIPGTALCVGASINFITGIEKRAPSIYQKLALEWLFRTFVNPKKMIPRYTKCALDLTKISLKISLRTIQNATVKK